MRLCRNLFVVRRLKFSRTASTLSAPCYWDKFTFLTQSGCKMDCLYSMEKKNIQLKNKCTISYYDNGVPDAKTLFFVHGWAADKDNLKAVYHSLEDTFRVIALDLPGFGESSRPPGNVGSPEYAEYIKEFLEILGISRVIYTGHSFGGKIGILLALSCPDLVEKLVLIDSSGLRAKRNVLWYLKVYFFKLQKFFYLKISGSKKGLEKLKNRYGSDDYKNAGPMRDIMVKTVNEDYREKLKDISCPVFLYWGACDKATPLWMAKKMEALIPDSALYVVKKGSHFSFLEDDRIIHIIRSFAS